jgi:FtsP/CotA-like multicopper oxidase with cupredoxin domain
MKRFNSYLNCRPFLVALSLLAISGQSLAEIQSESGTVVDLWAKQFQIATPDGDSIRMWGFALGNEAGPTGEPQYPAPTLRVNAGDFVEITVHNWDVPQDVTLEFPGQNGVCARRSTNTNRRCLKGNALANAAARAGGRGQVVYSFTAHKPGTYMYQSGINPQIQIDMGLVGAFIVDPDPQQTRVDAASGVVTINGVSAPEADHHARGLAYNDAATAYDREYLFFLSETDPKLHYLAELDKLDRWDNGDYASTLFFINGRNAPDTLAGDFIPQLPNQPYGSIVMMHPGQRILLRVINAGRNQHPLHLHGNHFDQIARDGNLIGKRDASGAVSEIRAITDYTYGAVQGGTSDLLFHWTGEGLGWDMYGTGPGFEHSCDAATEDLQDNITHAPGPDGYHDVTWESCADHGKPLPVVLPENLDLAFGGFWGGSPYLGNTGTLPVGEGGLNPAGGMVFMWHSHAERELTNNDIYPGGMLTMMLVIPYEEGAGDAD